MINNDQVHNFSLSSDVWTHNWPDWVHCAVRAVRAYGWAPQVDSQDDDQRLVISKMGSGEDVEIGDVDLYIARQKN
jgi:hypothetical protein